MSPVCRNVLAKWIRWGCLVVFFAVVLSGLHYRVKSRDAAGNLAVSGDFSFTTAAAPPPTTYSIWPLSTIPTIGMEDPGSAIEVGLKFRSNVNGYITDVRFYKGGPETGSAHIGNLWTSSGTLLGSVTFANQTASGWQQASFSTPIPITANTTYVVSYFAPQGNYLGEDDFFATSGVTNGPLHALQDGVEDGNGIYRYTPTSGFPTDTYRSENYWVDVVFTTEPPGSDMTPPTVASVSPAAGAANVNANANVTVTFSEAMTAASVTGATVELRDPLNALVSATVSYNGGSFTATLDPTAPLAAGITYTARIRGGGTDPRVKDLAGNALAADVTWTFTTAPPPDTTPPTVTSFAPAAGAANVNANANVTVTFSEAMNAATVNGSTVELRDPSNTLVSATVSYHPASFTATLDPSAPLAAGVTYTARIRGGGIDPRIKDAAGNALAANVEWTFTINNCFANVPVDQWKGEYFNNINLSGDPMMARNDGAGFLNFNFGLGSPGAACGIGVDNFSARWTRTVNFAAATYHFSVTGDDGVRLYIDGQLKINAWIPQGPTAYTAIVALTAGPHVIRLEYFEGGGPGVAMLSWAEESFSVASVNPGAYQSPDPGQGGNAVTSQSNMGHAPTNISATAAGVLSDSQTKTSIWSSFPSVSGSSSRVTVKFDWSVSGILDADGGGSGTGSSSVNLTIELSTDNGASWPSNLVNSGDFVFAFGDNTQSKPVNFSGSVAFDIANPSAINVAQVKVREKIFASADKTISGIGNASASVTITNIRLEVETVNCPANVHGDRWRGEYFNNTTLSGIPPTVRDDGADSLNFNWGGDPPAGTCGVPADNFSARWTRTVNFPRGLYRFTVTADDGVRLYVGGQLKINQWIDQGPTTYTADVFLPAGNHEVKLEYYERIVGAMVSLNWTTLVNCVANVPTDRWIGEYYNTTNLTGDLAMASDDGDGFLNLNFGGGSPSAVCGLGVDNFSARWTRTVNFAAGTYRFIATVNDGVRLYVDGQLTPINHWAGPPNTYTADVPLSAGNHVIKLEFVEYTGDASISLSWLDVINCIANVPADRWKGEYFNNITLSGPPLVKRDDGGGPLHLDFGSSSPSAACSLPADNFSARWTRTVDFAAGTYRFTVTGDDGVRLYVGGQLKIDKWFAQGATTYTANVTLTADAYEVKLEYFESGGPGIALLSWTRVPGINCLPVP